MTQQDGLTAPCSCAAYLELTSNLISQRYAAVQTRATAIVLHAFTSISHYFSNLAFLVLMHARRVQVLEFCTSMCKRSKLAQKRVSLMVSVLAALDDHTGKTEMMITEAYRGATNAVHDLNEDTVSQTINLWLNKEMFSNAVTIATMELSAALEGQGSDGLSLLGRTTVSESDIGRRANRAFPHCDLLGKFSVCSQKAVHENQRMIAGVLADHPAAQTIFCFPPDPRASPWSVEAGVTEKFQGSLQARRQRDILKLVAKLARGRSEDATDLLIHRFPGFGYKQIIAYAFDNSLPCAIRECTSLVYKSHTIVQVTHDCIQVYVCF